MENSSLEVIKKIKVALDEYNRLYNTNFELLEERKYNLVPNDEEYGYNDEWPGNKHAGVYFIMTKDNEILYIGQSQRIGKRLNEHFPSKSNGLCNVHKENWQKKPSYLYVILVHDERKWERLSLEEFLIQKFKPIDNT